jgi:hypothetical protein
VPGFDCQNHKLALVDGIEHPVITHPDPRDP